MLRPSLLIGAATVALTGVSLAQMSQAQTGGQSRDDLLDALTRHIQICNDIADSQQRLACFDRMQNQVGGAAPPAAKPAPTPTPLQANPVPPMQSPPPLSPAPTTGSTISSAPLSSQPMSSQPSSSPQPLSPPPAPPPLTVPGGGVATLDNSSPSTGMPPGQDPNAAFDPRNAPYRAPEMVGPRPQPQMRRTGPRPIPYSSTPQPLVTLGANNLTYGNTRYWQVTVTLTSNTPRPVNAQAECTFMNAGRAVSSDYLGPIVIQPGEQITNELIGPPTTTYVDSTNCRVTSP